MRDHFLKTTGDDGFSEPQAINSYDIDGVIFMGPGKPGLIPRDVDVIITGRSGPDEAAETYRFLDSLGLKNPEVYMNPVRFIEKTRETSGLHKARTLRNLKDRGRLITFHYEDDEVQAKIIQEACPWIRVLHLKPYDGAPVVNQENEKHDTF